MSKEVKCPTCTNPMVEMGSLDSGRSWLCPKCSKLLLSPTTIVEADDRTVKVYPQLGGLISFTGELVVDTTQPDRLDAYLSRYGGNVVKLLEGIKNQRPIQSFFKLNRHYLVRVFGGTELVEEALKQEAASWVTVIGPLRTDGGEEKEGRGRKAAINKGKRK